jgi:hypothetical protein
MAQLNEVLGGCAEKPKGARLLSSGGNLETSVNPTAVPAEIPP